MSTDNIQNKLPQPLFDFVAPLIKRDEGIRYDIYDDKTGKTVRLPTEGNVTIGVGWNLTGNGLPKVFVDMLFVYALNEIYEDLQNLFPLFADYSVPRQAALLNMRYNLGPKRLREFVHFIMAVQDKDWGEAAQQLQNSQWYRELTTRVKRVIGLLVNEKEP